MRLSNYPEYADDALYGRQPEVLWGTTAPDGDADSPVEWKSARDGTLYVRSDGTDSRVYQKRGNVPEDADWKELGLATGGTSVAAEIGVPLHTLYRVASNNAVEPLHTGSLKRTIPIPLVNILEVGSNNFFNAAANGGVLATDTTPIKEYTNGDTDSSARFRWAAGNSDPLHIQFPIPLDYDEASDFTFRVLAAMGGATNTPALTLESYFGVGGSKVTDTTGNITGTTPALYTATIAHADIPASAKTMSIEITPGSHGTDTLLLYSAEMEYTVKVGPYYGTVNGDTDSNRVVTWPAGDVTPVVFEVFLPSDLDDDENVLVNFWAKSGGATDTPALSLDSYFDEGDTKVEDDSAALTSSYAKKTATIAASDVPTTPHKLTVEVTPGTHSTDAVLLSMISVSYTRL